MTDVAATASPAAGAVQAAAALAPSLGEGAKAPLEKDGGRYIPPFLLWSDGGDVVVGLVEGGRVMASGAACPAAARELAKALLECAGGVEAGPLEELWDGPARAGWNVLSQRTLNALLWNDYKTVADLMAAMAADLTDIRNFGAGCLAEARRVLGAHGLALTGEEAPCPR